MHERFKVGDPHAFELAVHRSMIAFRVSVDGDVKTTAAPPGNGVLSCILCAGTLRLEQRQYVELRVAGLDDDDHLRWLDIDSLSPGTLVLIEILDDADADEPVSREPNDHESNAKIDREQYEWAKRIYLEGKHEYDG